MISSPVVKVIEAIALGDLKDKLEKKISKAQVGFLPKLGTQVHILRLLGRVQDIQDSFSSRLGNGEFFILIFALRSMP